MNRIVKVYLLDIQRISFSEPIGRHRGNSANSVIQLSAVSFYGIGHVTLFVALFDDLALVVVLEPFADGDTQLDVARAGQ